MNMQYTLGSSRGTSGGSNEANTAANNARTLEQFEYEDGYNNFDVRHTFNLSLLYSIPYGRGGSSAATPARSLQAVLGGWEVGGILNARSGVPINVLVTRPDILYRESATGLYYTGPAAGRVAVINTPGGGASRNVRRPDLVPGVDPFIKDGGLLFLNPAAFAAPLPGTFGNMERNSIHGPSFTQTDFFFSKEFRTGGRSNVEFRMRGLQPLQHRELRQPRRHAERGRPGHAWPGQHGAAWTGVHRRRGRSDVRSADQHGRTDRRPRHAASGAVRTALPVLNACSYEKRGDNGSHGGTEKRSSRVKGDAPLPRFSV